MFTQNQYQAVPNKELEIRVVAKCATETNEFVLLGSQTVNDLILRCNQLFELESCKIIGLTKGKFPEDTTLRLDTVVESLSEEKQKTITVKLMVIGTKQSVYQTLLEEESKFIATRALQFERDKKEKELNRRRLDSLNNYDRKAPVTTAKWTVVARQNDEAEMSGKLILPSSFLQTLVDNKVSFPLMFEISQAVQGTARLSLLPAELGTAKNNNKTYCGVHDFNATLDFQTIYVPSFVLSDLKIPDGSFIECSTTQLPLGTYCKLQPSDPTWLDVGEEERQALLETQFSTRTFLKTGDCIIFWYNRSKYEFHVLETKPANVIAISNTDLQTEIVTSLKQHPTTTPLATDGSTIQAEIKGDGSSNYFSLTVKNEEPVTITLNVTAGDADLYVSTQSCTSQPSHLHHQWMSQHSVKSSPQKQITLSQSDRDFTNGAYYIAVRSYAEPIIENEKTSSPPKTTFNISASVLQKITDKKSNGNVVVANEKKCTNCQKMIPISNYNIHIIRCARTNWKCPQCDCCMNVLEKSKHIHVVHGLYSCPRECCSLKNQLSQKEMILHTLNDCPLRLIQCIYCPLRIPKMDVGAHQNICGSREATCLSCKAKHKRKEIGRHVHKIHGKALHNEIKYGREWI